MTSMSYYFKFFPPFSWMYPMWVLTLELVDFSMWLFSYFQIHSKIVELFTAGSFSFFKFLHVLNNWMIRIIIQIIWIFEELVNNSIINWIIPIIQIWFRVLVKISYFLSYHCFFFKKYYYYGYYYWCITDFWRNAWFSSKHKTNIPQIFCHWHHL